MAKWKNSFASNSRGSLCAAILGIACTTLITLQAQTLARPPQKISSTVRRDADMRSVEGGKFRCPETLPDPAEREKEVEKFLVWTKEQHPKWTLEQVLNFRIDVLTRNKCAKTLFNIDKG